MAPRDTRVRDGSAPLTSTLNALVARAARDGVYQPPPGRDAPRRRRRPASLRHLAEVIGSHKLAPGYSVDKDVVGAVLAGVPRYLGEAPIVVAVAHAAHLIAGLPFTADDARRMTVAAEHVAALAAEEHGAAPATMEHSAAPATMALPDAPVTGPAEPIAAPAAAPVVLDADAAPRPRRRRWAFIAAALAVLLPGVAGVAFVALRDDPPSHDAACRDGAAADEIITDTARVFRDDEATRLDPTLDFDAMNGSARYARYQGRTYYWGRAGSDDGTPFAGGSRVRWRVAEGAWHSCPSPLAATERGYVRSPAVATTIGGKPVTIQVCLWRDEPRRENCTAEIRTG
jgi:hypothetical protein